MAAVYDAIDGVADTMKIYVNGVLDGSSTYTLERAVSNSTPVVLGAYFAPANTFAGSMDEVSIFRGALAASEVLSIYNAAAGGKSSMPAFAGTYSATGLFPGILAPQGYYVASTGATAPTAALPGYYVDTVGATQQTIAPLVYYVPGPAATAPTIAPMGMYVPTLGATGPVEAGPGYYVNTAGASSQNSSVAGSLCTRQPGDCSDTGTQGILR